MGRKKKAAPRGNGNPYSKGQYKDMNKKANNQHAWYFGMGYRLTTGEVILMADRYVIRAILPTENIEMLANAFADKWGVKMVFELTGEYTPGCLRPKPPRRDYTLEMLKNAPYDEVQTWAELEYYAGINGIPEP